ncbi:Ketol-acid reductoisomerase (NADP(+)), partial [Clarias magur]
MFSVATGEGRDSNILGHGSSSSRHSQQLSDNGLQVITGFIVLLEFHEANHPVVWGMKANANASFSSDNTILVFIKSVS